MKKLSHSQRGFTLIELLIVIALTGIIAAAITMSIGQVFTGTARSNDHNTAINQVSNAVYWISRDAQMAQNVTPDSGTTSGFPLKFVIPMTPGNTYNVTYFFDGDKLKRQKNTDPPRTIAKYIDSDDPTKTNCDFIDSNEDGINDTLTVNITAQVGINNITETRTFQVNPRPDQTG